MKKVLILVEGQTEETIVRDTLNPHLGEHGIVFQPVILKTKKEKWGKTFKGGVSSFSQVRRDVRALLLDSSAAAVTTLIDYYGLPSDFPGMTTRPGGSPRQRVAHVEKEFGETIGDTRFVPHLTLHEIEAWVFVDPQKCGYVLSGVAAQKFIAIRDACGGPEDINEDARTAPSKRILSIAPEYQKPFHGPLAIDAIGMKGIRASCPHADHWLKRIEALRHNPR